mmetsp:Transcript_20342/g.42658  ORF Transcript_20342/g.42658 Transcript_20342/m.42658 type:complete len:99 (-) Transcript_20342:799-1095(-)
MGVHQQRQHNLREILCKFEMTTPSIQLAHNLSYVTLLRYVAATTSDITLFEPTLDVEKPNESYPHSQHVSNRLTMVLSGRQVNQATLPSDRNEAPHYC